MHHSQYRDTASDQSNIHSEFVVAFDELLGAVERIDEEECRAARGHNADRHTLLGNDRDPPRGPPQAIEENSLGLAVGNRDG